jgi:hypothetical protein
MKKKEILELVLYRKHKMASRYGKKWHFYEYEDKLADPLKKLRSINGIEKKIKAIDAEFERLRNIRKVSEDYISLHEKEVESIECTHPIVFVTWGWGGSRHCALCNKKIDDTKNKVKLIREKRDYDCDDFCPKYPLELYGFEDILAEYNRFYELLDEMLEDFDDDDEINFIQLFNKGYEDYDVGTIEVEVERVKKKKIGE